MSDEIKGAFDGFGRALEEFKRENTTRLAEIEAKGRAASDLEAKVDRIAADLALQHTLLQDVQAKANRQHAPHGDVVEHETRDAFAAYIRRGEQGLSDIERKALATAPDSAGGYLVPDGLAQTLIRPMLDGSILYPRATRVQTSLGTLTLPVNSANGAAAIVGEGVAETEADETFGSITLTVSKIKTAMAVSEELLQDNVFNLEAFIAQNFQQRVAVKEETLYFEGTGSSQPTGVLVGATTAKTTASASAITFDEVMDVFGALKAVYHSSAIWTMNQSTWVALLKIKTGVASDARYIWTSDLSSGAPMALMGRPVYLSSNMPAIAASKKTILFFDPAYYYIAERPSVAIQRDPYSQGANGRVVFRLWRRVDGKVALAEAVQCLLMHA